MDDRNLFAVEDPGNGEMGYCTVLGGAGQEFGLGVFLGAPGLTYYLDLVNGKLDPEDFESASSVRSLSFTLADRESLRPRDLAVIRSLGLKFRGRNAWPCFLSAKPGYLPWHLEADEVDFLADAIREAIVVALAVRDDGLDLKAAVFKGFVSVRRFRDGRWHHDRVKMQPAAASEIDPAPPDEVRLARLLGRARRVSGSWEVGIFRAPAAIRSGPGQPPYLPTCVAVADSAHGLVRGFELLGATPSPQELQEAIVKLLEKGGTLPESLSVANDAAHRLAKAVASGLHIELQITDLPIVNDFQAGMIEIG
jgi:hypothetical protein